MRFVPLQAPPQLDPSLVHAVRSPWGAPVAATQVPTLPVTSQASHCPLQPVSQHTPSAQWAELQAPLRLHVAPFVSSGRHTPEALQ